MRVWVEAASAIFIEETFWNQQVNPQKLVVFHGDAKKKNKIECLCFSEYCNHWNINVLFFCVKINCSVWWNKHFAEQY